MATAYLGLGTNVGNKRGNLVTAAALLAERVGDVLALSDMYETEPWGFESDNTFLNAVIVMTTELSPMELLDATRLIEIEMGRIEKSDGVYHDRIIDIDLLMVDEQILHTRWHSSTIIKSKKFGCTSKNGSGLPSFPTS